MGAKAFELIAAPDGFRSYYPLGHRKSAGYPWLLLSGSILVNIHFVQKNDLSNYNKGSKFSQENSSVRIAIVGYGATGVAVFHHLTTKLAASHQLPDIAFHIFEPSDNLCTGLAYSTKIKT